MNELFIGTGNIELVPKQPFLLIDDGSTAEAFITRYKARVFNPTAHSFNPLRGIGYLEQCQLIEILLSAFPAGANTLTKEGVPEVLFTALEKKPKRLDQLLKDKSEDPSYLSAQRMIRRILRSPVLENVLCRPTNFSFKGNVVVKLDRSVLGDFDCFILANLLIGQFKGHIIVLDGFYLRPHHISLLRQNRLTAGVRELKELPLPLNLFKEKHGKGCLYEDAVELAKYNCPHLPSTDGYGAYIRSVMA